MVQQGMQYHMPEDSLLAHCGAPRGCFIRFIGIGRQPKKIQLRLNTTRWQNRVCKRCHRGRGSRRHLTSGCQKLRNNPSPRLHHGVRDLITEPMKIPGTGAFQPFLPENVKSLRKQARRYVVVIMNVCSTAHNTCFLNGTYRIFALAATSVPANRNNRLPETEHLESSGEILSRFPVDSSLQTHTTSSRSMYCHTLCSDSLDR